MSMEELNIRLTAVEVELASHRGEWLALHDQVVTMLGKSAGLKAGWLYLLGFVAAMGTLISIIHIFVSG